MDHLVVVLHYDHNLTTPDLFYILNLEVQTIENRITRTKLSLLDYLSVTTDQVDDEFPYPKRFFFEANTGKLGYEDSSTWHEFLRNIAHNAKVDCHWDTFTRNSYFKRSFVAKNP